MLSDKDVKLAKIRLADYLSSSLPNSVASIKLTHGRNPYGAIRIALTVSDRRPVIGTQTVEVVCTMTSHMNSKCVCDYYKIGGIRVVSGSHALVCQSILDALESFEAESSLLIA